MTHFARRSLQLDGRVGRASRRREGGRGFKPHGGHLFPSPMLDGLWIVSIVGCCRLRCSVWLHGLLVRFGWIEHVLQEV